MGAQSSTSVINDINTRVTNVVAKSVVNCNTTSTQTQDQNVEITGWFSAGDTNVTATQTVVFDIKCATSSDMMSKIQNDITSAIAATTTSSGVSVLPAFGNTSANAMINLHNAITSNVTSTNIINNYNTIMQSQKQNVINRVLFQFGSTNVTATQGAKVFVDAVLKAVTDSGVLSNIQSQLQQQSSAVSANPLDFITKTVSALFTGITGFISSWAVIPLAFIIGLVVFLVILFRSASGGEISKGVSTAIANVGPPSSKAARAATSVVPMPVAKEELSEISREAPIRPSSMTPTKVLSEIPREISREIPARPSAVAPTRALSESTKELPEAPTRPLSALPV